MKPTAKILLSILLLLMAGFILIGYIPTSEANETKIKQLHPRIRTKVRRLIHLSRLVYGVKLLIISGLRSFQVQDVIWQQGRSLPGNIVTNAKAGMSYHNYGLAIDVQILNKDFDSYIPKVGRLGAWLGFTWGGYFKNLVDRPHFQYTFGKDIGDYLATWQAGYKTGPYVNISRA